jgi:isopentenyl-diphosphate delta-isomerase
MEFVVLVDEADKAIGLMEKMQAHVFGSLHRAMSVFIFNSKGEMLLQQRAAGKYHSAGLWTNACCGHPREGESALQAAHRRLYEEIGLTCSLKPAFTFIYKAQMPNGLTEYEFDHVFFGISDTTPRPNPDEVGSWKYITVTEETTVYPQVIFFRFVL